MACAARPRIRRELMDAFRLPVGNVAIAFSGGRTSAMMLHHIAEANGDIPDRAIVSFQNTGREMPETLDFVQECSERWGIPVTWLEYRAEKTRFEVVSHNSASRDGEPFAALIKKRRMAPNRVARFCTAEMKVHCLSRYLRSLGWGSHIRAIGIRADEAGRIPSKPPREKFTLWHPMADAGLTKRDVSEFWDRQPFNLRLFDAKGKTPQGNCDGCFLKSEANLAALARDYPERAQWWADMEAMLLKNVGKSGCTWFNQRRPMAGLIDMVDRQGDMVFDTEGFLCQADDGECMA